MKAQVTRRHFIRSNVTAALAAAALPSLVPAAVLGREGKVAPGNRITMGCIGVGPQGRGVMGNFLNQPDAQVVVVCDLAQRNLQQAVKQVNQGYKNESCQTSGDFREVLARKDIDAVLIATPDHWHVPVAIAAAKADKDMYLEKPMGLSVAEDQMLRKAVQQHKRIFQFGTQQRSSEQFRQACELVRNGQIGKLKQIDVWCVGSRPGGSTKPTTVPEGLNYDMWLGPAPQTPYTDGKCFDDLPPGTWKTWWYNYDYALGFIAGWGVHPLDIAYWGHPEMMKGTMDIEGEGIIPTEGACNTSIAWDVRFVFANGVRMQYRAVRNGYDQQTELNDMTPWQQKFDNKLTDHGTAFEGTEGWVVVDRSAIRTYPERLVEEKSRTGKVQLIKSNNHARNFLDSVKSRQNTICPIEDAVQADILCHVSDIATRLERKLQWDPAKEHFVKDDEANHRLALRPMREAWRL
jgi:predicted dehydrogenase